MAQEQTIKCPFCAEEIKTEAVVCRFCGRSLLDADRRIKEAKAEIVARKKTGKQLPIGCAFLAIGIILIFKGMSSSGSVAAFMGGFVMFFIGFFIVILLRIRAWWHTGR